MDRIVKIKLPTNNNLLSFKDVDARTFGDLKSELSDIDWAGKRVIIMETRTQLSLNDAHLPTTGFTLLLFPAKTKSGVDFEDLGYHELRREMSKRNLSHNGVTSADMRTKLAEYDASNNGSDDVDVDAIIAEAEKKIVSASLDHSKAVKIILDDLRDALSGVSVSTPEEEEPEVDVDAEYGDIQSQL